MEGNSEFSAETKRAKYQEEMEEGNRIQKCESNTKSGRLTVESIILRLITFF